MGCYLKINIQLYIYNILKTEGLLMVTVTKKGEKNL